MRDTVSWGFWLATVAALAGLVGVDLFVIAKRDRPITTRDALFWVSLYVSLAILFGAVMYATQGHELGVQFFAGYVTEYTLSVDNLLVFVVIMARFTVPALARDKVLYIGILVSLVLRGLFIVVGAAVISAFSWVFYIFGGFLVVTGLRLTKEGPATDADLEPPLSRVLVFLARILPMTPDYAGRAMSVHVDNRRRFTPLITAIAAIGVANVVFALDSIPAIFGLTHSAFVVFTANTFALMGLRQLYFLLERLLERLIYLNVGLAVILIFIGSKMIREALQSSGINRIAAINLPTIGTVASLLVIAATLAAVVLASLLTTTARLRREERGG